MRKLAGAAGLLTGSSLLGLVLSFATQAYLAFRFGAGAEMDAYVAAMTIPALFLAVVIPSLSIVLIPIFAGSMRTRGPERTWRMTSTLLNVTTVALFATGALVHVSSSQLMLWLVPGLDPATRALSVELLKVLLPATLLMAPCTLLIGLFQAQDRFLPTAMAPIAGSTVLLATAFLLCPRLGVQGIAVAAVVGNLLQLLLLLPVLRGNYHPRFDLRDEGLRSMGRLIAPLILGGLVYRATIVADRHVASLLPVGSLSHLEYAGRIAALLLTLFASGIAAALYPRMSALAAAGEWTRLRDTLVWGQRIVMLFLFPALATGWVLRMPLLQVAFQRGQFSFADTEAVANIVSWFMLGVVGGSLGVLQARVYYVMKDTITPVWIGILEALAYFIYLPILANAYRAPGVGMANALYLLAAMVVNGIVVFRKMGGARISDLLLSAARLSLYGMMAGLSAYGGSLLFREPAAKIAAGSSAAAICYGALLYFARAREVQDLAGLVADAGISDGS